MQRVKMIERSLLCLRAGWGAMIPVLGIGFAVQALLLFGKAYLAAEDGWNPAQWYLVFGAALALLSFLLHGLAGSLILWALLQ